MTTFIIKVDDERTESLKKILNEIPYVKDFAIENTDFKIKTSNPQVQRIKGILAAAKGKDLFNDIKDPIAWQRSIRKEWDRDF